MAAKSFRDILSRSFATIEVDPTTGEKKEVKIEGKSIVTGRHFLADYEIENLVQELRETVANKE